MRKVTCSEERGNATTGQLSDEELRRQLRAKLAALVERLRERTPGFEPPSFSRQRLMALVEEMSNRFPVDVQVGILELLRASLGQDVFDPDVWKDVWYVVNYTLQRKSHLVKRRLAGEPAADEWGLDWDFVDAVFPFFTFLYRVYWRVETTGLENVPAAGRALLVANHSGLLPWDGVMIGTAVLNEHPAHRVVRGLYASLFDKLPFASAILMRLGQALATVENGTRLLEQDELVVVFPEGYKGLSKIYRDRYKLARFGRGGFVKMALNTHAPIIPVSVVGAEETSPILAKLPALTRVTGIPYIPISLTFPWLGLIGFIPLPTKWYIELGEPIPTDGYKPGAENNLVLVSQLADQVRNVVQEMIYARLAQRRSVFFS